MTHTSFYKRPYFSLETRIHVYAICGLRHPLVKWRFRAMDAGVEIPRNHSIRKIKKLMRKQGKL